jgi:hypothetical protein
MTEKTFDGISESGEFNEALMAAISAAKKGLKTDLVEWQLVRVKGKSGGFTDINDIMTTILASAITK